MSRKPDDRLKDAIEQIKVASNKIESVNDAKLRFYLGNAIEDVQTIRRKLKGNEADRQS